MHISFRFITLLMILFCTRDVFSEEVTFMGPDVSLDKYYMEILSEAFKHAESSIRVIKKYPIKIPHHRAFTYLSSFNDIDIVAGYATEARDEKYLAIPVPLLKGLNGWRLAVVHQDNINIFKNVDTFEQFTLFRAGQYHSWTDAIILQHNGVKIVPGSDYDGLFRMLDNKRFDYFPRSVLHARKETEIYSSVNKLKVVVEPNIVIRYPTASYFYVNKKNERLAFDIKLGLEIMVKNGRLNELFNQYFGALVSQLKLEKRKIFHLNNHLLPKSVPLDRKELWLQY
ncbi:MAG: substrate-binding periplasmic protein [Thalassotalea sp.]